MDTIEIVAALKRPTQQWTRGWMLTKATDEYALSLGLSSGRQFWICGRAGVLGDGDADVAAAGLAFLAPDAVREQWDTLPPGMTHRRVADEYASRIFAWGDAELPRFGEATLARLDELARRVQHAAPASLGAVFAGWRAMPPPPTLGARVALTMQVMREMRGAAHIVAVTAVGLTPLQAVLTSPAPPPRNGPEWAEHLGWTGPFEDAAPLMARRDEAEELTNRILAPFFDTLSPGQLAELATLVTDTRNAIDM